MLIHTQETRTYQDAAHREDRLRVVSISLRAPSIRGALEPHHEVYPDACWRAIDRPEIEDGVFGSNTKTLCQIWLE